MKKLFYFAICAFVLASCNDDDGGDCVNNVDYNRPGEGVFVCNQGNFGYSTASLDFYDIASGQVDNEIFYNANCQKPLGDVCNSMTIIDGKGYVVMNNSGRVVIIDINTFKYKGEIKNLAFPREIIKAGTNKIYISDQSDPAMPIYNTATGKITGKVTRAAGYEIPYDPDNNPERPMPHDPTHDYVYVCSWSYNDSVFKIDTQTDQIVAAAKVNKQPNSVVVDGNGFVWVLSDGGYASWDPSVPSYQGKPALARICPWRFIVLHNMEIDDLNSSPSKLTLSGDGQTLYFLNSYGTTKANGVYKMPVTEDLANTTAFIPEPAGTYFYALGVDPSTSEIYIGDALDYTQRGVVYRYNATGTKLGEFNCGIIPGAFCFKR